MFNEFKLKLLFQFEINFKANAYYVLLMLWKEAIMCKNSGY